MRGRAFYRRVQRITQGPSEKDLWDAVVGSSEVHFSTTCGEIVVVRPEMMYPVGNKLAVFGNIQRKQNALGESFPPPRFGKGECYALQSADGTGVLRF